MADAFGTYGSHIIHEDFYGGHKLATSGVNTEAVTTYTVDETDGVLALTTGGADGDTAVIGSGAVFSPATNGPLALEARIKMPSLSNQTAWIGFNDQSGGTDEVVDAGTVDASTVNAAGLYFDSAVDANQFNEYIATGGTETQQHLITETVTADQWVVGRVEIDPDGTVRTYYSAPLGTGGVGTGSLRQVAERPQAILPTAKLFPEVYSAGNTSATATVEIDYYHFTANRDWNVA